MKKRWLALLVAFSLLLSGCVIEIHFPESPEPGLTVHFIDVGQADCALLECGGEYMLIDGGNRDDSQLVVSYLEQQGVESLAAVVCTHAHEDHVGGLPGVLAVYPTKAVYAPTNTYSSKIFDSFLYYIDQQRLSVTIPAPGDTLTFGDATATVLGPVKSYPDANNTSIVLKVTYGDTSFLFTGDMEVLAENDMLDYWEDRMDFTCDVLKVGHHGSNTSSSYRLISEVYPTYGVISVGEGNDYGHPHREPMARLKQSGVAVLRTDNLGHIIARSDGTAITFTWENQNAQPEGVDPADGRFIGNKNSKTFHSSVCSGLPSEKNQIVFKTYQEAIDAGYTPCRNCLK